MQLRRQFRGQTFLPIVQFVFAVLIMAGVIYIVGLLAKPDSKPILTIFGLSGTAGSLAFLGVVVGSLVSVGVIYFVISRLGRQKAWMDQLAARHAGARPMPAHLVMSRFTLALQLTLDSGLSITKALQLSLDATGNAYFASRSQRHRPCVEEWPIAARSMDASGLFTTDFLEMIASSEVSGSVPEMMRLLAQQYQEETSAQDSDDADARRRRRGLAGRGGIHHLGHLPPRRASISTPWAANFDGSGDQGIASNSCQVFTSKMRIVQRFSNGRCQRHRR